MEHQNENRNDVPGALGPFLDNWPLITHANVRPYVIAILLHRGAVRVSEVLSALVPHCCHGELKSGELIEGTDPDLENKTRLEILVEQVLVEMQTSNMLIHYSKSDIWVLSAFKGCNNLPRIISWVTSMNSQLPRSITSEILDQKLNFNHV